MSLERAMHLATMDLDAIKPAPLASNPSESKGKYTPKLREEFGSWIVVSVPFSLNPRSENSKVKTSARRHVKCDCNCGRTLAKPIEVYRLLAKTTTQCRLCAYEQMGRTNSERYAQRFQAA